MRKFNRRFKLFVANKQNEFVEMEDPFTLDFNVNRTIGSDLNNLTCTIYNLNQKTRESIGRDRYDRVDGGTNQIYRQIILQIGYSELFTVFQGSLTEAISSRSGVDILTRLTAFDGGYAINNSYSSLTLKKGTPLKDALVQLIGDLKNVKLGTVEPVTDKILQTATTFDGNTHNLIKQYTDGDYFIDEERANIIGRNNSLGGQAFLINSSTGLLGTPKLANTFLEVETILEASVKIGQVVQIESKIRPDYDGLYKVAGIRHSGTISTRVAGNAKTTLQLYYGDKLFREVQTI